MCLIFYPKKKLEFDVITALVAFMNKTALNFLASTHTVSMKRCLEILEEPNV